MGDDYNADDYEQVTDILDVWFDSGSTHAFVLEDRDDLTPRLIYILKGLISIVAGFILHYCNLVRPAAARL